MPQSISEQNRWRPFHAAGHGGAQRLGCVQRLVPARHGVVHRKRCDRREACVARPTLPLRSTGFLLSLLSDHSEPRRHE